MEGTRKGNRGGKTGRIWPKMALYGLLERADGKTVTSDK